mmetsp:Transcript_796/g.1622  ORF Transcript_796/g.1622 Transcript_796/m.1622 type:complete len:329 (-) Transcript_796:42-1028(-)
MNVQPPHRLGNLCGLIDRVHEISLFGNVQVLAALFNKVVILRKVLREGQHGIVKLAVFGIFPRNGGRGWSSVVHDNCFFFRCTKLVILVFLRNIAGRSPAQWLETMPGGIHQNKVWNLLEVVDNVQRIDPKEELGRSQILSREHEERLYDIDGKDKAKCALFEFILLRSHRSKDLEQAGIHSVSKVQKVQMRLPVSTVGSLEPGRFGSGFKVENLDGRNLGASLLKHREGIPQQQAHRSSSNNHNMELFRVGASKVIGNEFRGRGKLRRDSLPVALHARIVSRSTTGLIHSVLDAFQTIHLVKIGVGAILNVPGTCFRELCQISINIG